MRPSVRATSLGCERARYEPGRHSGFSLMSLPSSTISRSSASFSAREPSTQWMRSGRVSAAISSTHATSAAIPAPCTVGSSPNARDVSGRAGPESAVRVKMSASAMGVAPPRSTVRSVFFLYFRPVRMPLPAASRRQELRFFRYHQGMPPTAAGAVHARPPHPPSARLARAHPRRTGRAGRRRRQPAEPHRERQARAEAVAPAGDRGRDRRPGHRPAVGRAAQPARRARDRARARAARLGVPPARASRRSRSPRA